MTIIEQTINKHCRPQRPAVTASILCNLQRAMFGFLLLAGMGVQAQTVTSFQDVTGTGPFGLNADVSKPAGPASAIEVPGSSPRLYVAWREVGGSTGTFQARVSVYNSLDGAPHWSPVDGVVNGAPRPSHSGINHNPAGNAWDPRLAVHAGELYATWAEGSQIRVARYNGNDLSPDWTFVDGNQSSAGINFNKKKSAHSPDLISFDGKLFVAWSEPGGSGSGSVDQVRVRYYDGSDWIWADPASKFGINYNGAQPARAPTFVILPGVTPKLYLAFIEFAEVARRTNRNQARLKVYGGGSTWSSADGDGTFGLNFDVTSHASAISVVAESFGIFMTWNENSLIRARYYDGASDSSPTWHFIDGSSAAQGINGSTPSTPAKFAFLGSGLYATFAEGNTPRQARVMFFDGAIWSYVDGSLNKSLAASSQYVIPAIHDGKVYVFWSEGSPSQLNVSVGLQ
jgi:hypothetical protein